MSIFVDSCVLIGYLLESDLHHKLCKRFIKRSKKKERIYCTYFTAAETNETYQRKLNQALMIVLEQILGKDFYGSKRAVHGNIQSIINPLKKSHSHLRGFLKEIERACMELTRVYGMISLDWLIEWVADAKGIYQSLEGILDCRVPSECPTFDPINKEQKGRIEKLIECIPFAKIESHDRLILLELAVLQHKYAPMEFYSVDEPFLDKAEECFNILEKEGEVKKCTVHFKLPS
jgi:predicted nucleic acid-binding protein